MFIIKTKGFKTKLTTHLEIDEKNGINCTTGSLGLWIANFSWYGICKKKIEKMVRFSS